MRTLAAAVLSLLLVACVTTREAALPKPGYGMEGVKGGDTVVVHLFNGDHHRFKVSYVDAVGIHGWNETYPYTDIRSVDVVERDYKPAQVLLALVGIGMLVALATLEPISFPATGPFCVYSSTDQHRPC